MLWVTRASQGADSAVSPYVCLPASAAACVFRRFCSSGGEAPPEDGSTAIMARAARVAVPDSSGPRLPALAQRTEAPQLEPRNRQPERDQEELDRNGRAKGVVGGHRGQASALDQVDACREADRHERRCGAQERDGWLVGVL